MDGWTDLSLFYQSKTNDMIAFSDASFADCIGSVSTCGYIIQLFGHTIAWRAMKQSYVSLSTCQAEYVAMSHTCQELVALQFSLQRILHESLLPIILYCDNMAAEICAITSGQTKLKHMTRVKEHYIRECVKEGIIKIQWVPSRDQLADIMTKPLSYTSHKELRKTILNEK